MQSSAIAVITEDTQNDVIAALHAAGVGHLTRVIRRERGIIADQLKRAGVDTGDLPATLPDADRVVLVTPAPRALETACLVLQRGATSAWTVTPEAGWEVVDDQAIEIAATRDLPARPVPPVHRSGRTFRKPNIRRRPRRGVSHPGRSSSAGESSPT
ncbi:MAG TPA: hypothetical protein VD789_08680 [Thermomicrobiales bacterium]|nr:hypothetical protein [Thermomicrobiales bacterium]